MLKLAFIAVEIAALLGIVCLIWSENTNCEPWIKSAFITLFTLLAIAMQKEQAQY